MPILFNPIDEIELTRQIVRQSYWDFIREFWSTVPGAGDPEWNWHMEYLANELQIAAERVFAGERAEYDLVANVCFGTSKSTIFSILFHPWTWTRMPSARHIVATHTDTLALDFADKSKFVIQSERYRKLFPDIVLRKQATGYYSNTLGGDRLACTVGGRTPTGFHGHFLNVDDPLDPKKAASFAELENAKNFMSNVLPSRKVNKETAFTSLVMQRLDRQDPTAVMLEMGERQNARKVKHILLPGELTESLKPPELAEKYQDGLMDPIRLPRKILEEYRAALGSYGYAGQVLQLPVPIGGGMFRQDWFNYRCKAAPYHAKRIRYWDRAASAGAGCFTVGTLIAKDVVGNYYVEHMERGQWEPDERNRIMRAVALRDRARYGPKNEPTIYVEAEGGSSGRDAWKSVARALTGFSVREDQVTGAKDVRAEPWACQLASGNVFLVDDGTWDINTYIQEHVLFKPDPTVKRLGRLKDIVDSSTGAYNLLIGRRIGGDLSLRSFLFGTTKKSPFRVVVCSKDELSNTIIEERAILISIGDFGRDDDDHVVNEDAGVSPEKLRNGDSDCVTESRIVVPHKNGVGQVNGNGQGHPALLQQNGTTLTGTPVCPQNQTLRSGLSSQQNGVGGNGEITTPMVPVPPLHAISNLLGSLCLQFDDINPAEVQDAWEESLGERIIKPEHGKKIWSLITKKRDPAYQVIVIQDEGEDDRRVMSIACAICDQLVQKRDVIYRPNEPEKSDWSKVVVNQHIYDTVKLSRNMVSS